MSAQRSRHHTETRVVANVVLDGRVGGPQRRIVLVGQRLRTTGWTTVMVFPPMGEELPKFLSAHRTRYACIELSRVRLQNPIFNLLRYIFRLPREVWQLAAMYRREGADLVHAYGLFSVQVAL